MDIYKFDYFKDNGEKIKPQLTDDWELGILRKGRRLISSSKLNTSFFIPEDKFSIKSMTLNIEISENKLIGSFIFSKKREIYDEFEYMEWLEEKNKIKEKAIKKKDLIEGQSYLLEDNSKVYFLGKKYISTFKGNLNSSIRKRELKKENFTPVSKRYLFSNERTEVFEIHNKMILKKEEETISKRRREKLIYKYYCNNPFIAYFRNNKKDIKEYIYSQENKCFSAKI
jgi:hypothetical protein